MVEESYKGVLQMSVVEEYIQSFKEGCSLGIACLLQMDVTSVSTATVVLSYYKNLLCDSQQVRLEY